MAKYTRAQWDARWHKLRKWIDDAAFVADIAQEQCEVWRRLQSGDEADCLAAQQVTDMLNFIGAIYRDELSGQQDFAGCHQDQAADYPHLARGLMLLATIVGRTARNEGGEDYPI